MAIADALHRITAVAISNAATSQQVIAAAQSQVAGAAGVAESSNRLAAAMTQLESMVGRFRR